jgi:hypothetical protein
MQGCVDAFFDLRGCLDNGPRRLRGTISRQNLGQGA